MDIFWVEVKVKDYSLSKTKWSGKTEWFFKWEIDRTPGVLPMQKRYTDEQGDGIGALSGVCTRLFNWAVCGGQTRDINEMSQQRDRLGKKIDKKRQASPMWSLQAHLTMPFLFCWVSCFLYQHGEGRHENIFNKTSNYSWKKKKQNANKQANKQKPKMDRHQRTLCSSVNQTWYSPLTYLVFSCLFSRCYGRWSSNMTHPGTLK